MPRTVPAALLKELRKDSFTPIVVAKIQLTHRITIRVLDYSVGGGETITITINGNAYDFEEGTDFSAGGSNAQCAQNLAAAFMDGTGVLPRINAKGTMARQFGTTGRVDFVGGASTTTLAVASTNSAFILVEDARPTTAYYCTGSNTLYPQSSSFILPSLAQTGPVGRKLNAVERTVSVGASDITWLADGELRRLGSCYPLKRRKVELYLGTPEIAALETDFETHRATDWYLLGTYLIKEPTPDYDSMTLKLGDALSVLTESSVKGGFLGMHPLQALEEGMSSAGLTSATFGDFFDFATLDPTLYPSKSHWTVSRWDDPYFQMKNAITEPMPLVDFAGELLLIMGGTFIVDSQGRLAYLDFDIDRVADYNLDATDLRFKQKEGVYDTLVNKVSVELGMQAGQSRQADTTELVDYDSYFAFGYMNEMALNSPWLNHVAQMSPLQMTGPSNVGVNATKLLPDTVSFGVVRASQEGFCGCRWTRDATSPWNWVQRTECQLADDDPTNARRSFLKIHPPGRVTGSIADDSAGAEIIAIGALDCDGSTVWEDTATTTNIPPGTRKIDDAKFPVDLPDLGTVFTIDASYTDATLGFVAGRAGFGTTTPDAWGRSGAEAPTITDVTIPYEMCRSRLSRFKFGAVPMETTLPLYFLGVQIGDFITFVNEDLALAYGINGSDATSVTYEVTFVEEHVFTSPFGIRVEVLFVRNNFTPIEALEWQPTVVYPVLPLDQLRVVDGDGNPVKIDIDGDGTLDSQVVL